MNEELYENFNINKRLRNIVVSLFECYRFDIERILNLNNINEHISIGNYFSKRVSSKINYVTDICFSLLILSSYTMNLMDLYIIMSISNNFNNIAMGIKDQTDSLKDIVKEINDNFIFNKDIINDYNFIHPSTDKIVELLNFMRDNMLYKICNEFTISFYNEFKNNDHKIYL